MHSAQLPLLAVAAACCLSLARAADELSAAPVDEGVVEYCRSDEDCRWAGDAGAACSLAACVCSTHSGSLCQVRPSGEETTRTTPTNLVVTLPDVACEPVPVGELVAETKRRITATGVANPSVVSTCGSVTIIAQVDALTADLAASVANVTAAMRESVVVMSNFTKVFSADDVAVKVFVSQSTSGQATCTANAVNTVVAYDGRCVVLECAVGFSVSRFFYHGKEHSACTQVVSRSAGDDDLSGAAIGAIVIGCVFFTLVLAGLVYLMCFSKTGGDMNRHGPYDGKENHIQV